MDPIYLVALACPVGMGLMMLLMGKGMMGMGRGDRHEPDAATPPSADPDKQIAVLQAQRQLLDAQIASMERPDVRESGAGVAGEKQH